MSLRLGLALYIRLSDIFRCLSFAISVGESITLTALAKDLQREDMGQHTRFWYNRIGEQRRHRRVCADSSESSLLPCTKLLNRGSRWPNISHLAPLDTSKRAFK